MFLAPNFPANVYGAKTTTGLPSNKRLARTLIKEQKNIVYLHAFLSTYNNDTT